MGRPYEALYSPRAAEDGESSSSGDEEGWVEEGEEDWEDPSGGVLSRQGGRHPADNRAPPAAAPAGPSASPHL